MRNNMCQTKAHTLKPRLPCNNTTVISFYKNNFIRTIL